jgi:hypothetical protein
MNLTGNNISVNLFDFHKPNNRKSKIDNRKSTIIPLAAPAFPVQATVLYCFCQMLCQD